MLKLTKSFYRYLRVATEKVHGRKFTYLARKKTCNTEWSSKLALLHTSHIFRQKKRLRIRIPSFNSNDSCRNIQMSDHKSHINHDSNEAVLEISSDEDDSAKQWRRRSDESPRKRKEQQIIPPDFRIWETIKKHGNSSNGKPFKFKVVSYNVLAQCLLEQHRELYTECSPQNLKWNVRSSRLYDEITKLAPDILCLQEVQASHLNSFFFKFEQLGYFGIYKRKTGERKDGCAIYIKQSLFVLEDQASVEFYQPHLPILNRDNIGIMVKLIPRSAPGNPIIVATTHLLYNPKRTDVRLAQIKLFLAEIDRFSYYNNGRESGHYPTIITGDLNSTPDSAVIKLIEKGQVRINSQNDVSDWERIGITDNCQHLCVYLNRQKGQTTSFHDVQIFNSDYSATSPDVESGDACYSPTQFSNMFNSEVIGHSLNFKCVYDKYKKDGQNEASTYQDYWVTVDYIYFSELQLLERLRLPTADECAALGCLPNHVYGSDHLALAAVFQLAHNSA